MRQVQRGSAPSGFENQAKTWQVEFETIKSTDSKITPQIFWSKVRQRQAMQRYAETLYQAFQHKCVFCEVKPVAASLQIEHYRPKSHYLDLMFAWENWLVACPVCNTAKGDQFLLCQEQPCLIDPTAENPADHVSFICSEILSKTNRGKHTITKIKLNRTILVESRKRWLLQLDTLLLLLLHVPAIKDEARTLLIWSMQADAPFSAMSLAYLSHQVPKFAQPETPHPLVNPTQPIERIHALVEQHKPELREII